MARDLYKRIYYFPTAVARTRAKLRSLEREALDMGAADIARQIAAANAAWDREAAE